jgi:putative transposase
MSRTEIYLHVVFAVKRREPILTVPKRRLLFQHIREKAFLNEIYLITINGVEDHIHLLLRLHAYQTIAGVAQQIKGESARWANQVQLFGKRLTWASGYYARSVDPENLEVVTRYIFYQPLRHGPSAFWLADVDK